jgi:FKBP-type peptidyl-prolyl cis-trans isomerase FkpA
MIKRITLVVCVAIAFAACKKTDKETPSGMKYTLLKEGDGKLAKTGEMIVFDYQLKDSKDSVWSSTFKEGVPAATMIGDSTKLAKEDGMTQMFRYLSAGDSVVTTMRIGEFYKKLVRAPIPQRLDTNLNVTYTIAVRQVTKLEDYLKDREAQVAKRDDRKISDYINENKLTAQQDTSGLRYIIHNQAGGPKPGIDNCVEVKYEGRFMQTGQVFDKAERVAFPLNGVIAGWRLGIPLLGIGDSATLFIPSKLAYGPQGYPGAIPPDAILIFNVTLLDVKKDFDRESRTCK